MRRNRGYLLLEVLVYVGIVGVGINLCAGLFISGARLSAVNTLALDRMNALNEIHREFGQAVRGAVAVVPECGPYKTGPGQVVLAYPPLDGQRRYVVLGTVQDAEHLSKQDLVERDGVLEMHRQSTYGLALEDISFSYDTPARLVRLDVVIQPEAGERRRAPVVHHFVAAPRGMGGQT